MKKYILLFIGLCFLSAQVDAQVAFATAKELSMISRGVAKSVRKGNPLYIPGKARVGRTGLYPFQVTRVLRRRVARTYRQARTEREKIPPQYREIRDAHMLPTARLENITPAVSTFAQPVSYARSPKQMALYSIAQENRLYLQELTYLHEQIKPQLQKNLPRLRQAAIRSAVHTDPLTFVVRNIPEQVNTIALGEVHGFQSIRSFMAQFLTLLREQRPQQEIFIFTEAFAQGKEFLHKNGKYSVLPPEERAGLKEVWQAARDNHIPIIGLEPEEVIREISGPAPQAIFTHEEINAEYITPFAASLDMLRWRNASFANILRQYRQQHPDALFIVHAGRKHVDYTVPTSLTAHLDAQKTFVVHFTPTLGQVYEKYPSVPPQKMRFVWDPIGDKLDGKESLAYPFLFLDDPALSHLTGANALIRAEKKFLHNAKHTTP